MIRLASAVAGLLALVVPAVAPTDIHAVDLAKAFKAGTADQFRNKQVSGNGVDFHGPIEEKLADGSTRRSMVMTLGSLEPDGRLSLINSPEEFAAAERARTTLVVALSGPDLPQSEPKPGSIYLFSGVYDGQVRTVARSPAAKDSTVPESGPCPGETPRPSVTAGTTFYCAPLLTGATATLQR
jgi:hypothetical protein